MDPMSCAASTPLCPGIVMSGLCSFHAMYLTSVFFPDPVGPKSSIACPALCALWNTSTSCSCGR